MNGTPPGGPHRRDPRLAHGSTRGTPGQAGQVGGLVKIAASSPLYGPVEMNVGDVPTGNGAPISARNVVPLRA